METRLTPRQVQVLRLLSRGKSSRDIAGALCISVKTVEFHGQAIRDRLQLH